MITPESILQFWFGDDPAVVTEEKTKLWFGKEAATDKAIEQFIEIREQAVAGDLVGWLQSANGMFAQIILIDQFSRNLFRGNAAAFEYDRLAQALATTMVAENWDQQLTTAQRVFVYLVFEHAEDRFKQAQSVGFFTQLLREVPADQKQVFENFLQYAKFHQNIIERFGRFPHRNQALGRESTPEELAFLQQPNSSF